MIEYCNNNSGFFSMILAVIAIYISIRAISAQNKGVVFEKRLEIYCAVSKIYKNSARIVQICSGKSLLKQRNLIAAVMFDINSREIELVHQFGKLSDTEKEVQEDSKGLVIADYMQIYLEKYLNDPVSTQVEIFYNSQISESVKQLVNHYDNMRLGILAYNQSELDEWIEKLNSIVMDMEQKEILGKMKKQLPL